LSQEVRYDASAKYFARLFAPFLVAIAAAVPAILIEFGALHPGALASAGYFGLAIVAAAFMLGWVGEAAELDMSGGLSIGLLAVIAILPEYVVSTIISFQAGTNPAMAPLATANLTGANRLLIGFGWPVVALCGWFALRKAKSSKKFGIELEPQSKTDIGFMIWATIISLIVPLTGEISIVVGIVMVVLFVSYLWRVSQEQNEEPELHGTAAYVGALPKWGRRAFLLVVALMAAGIILVCAEPFTENLIEAGTELGWDKYLLIQWITPLASEAPEFTLAFIFAARGKAQVALAVLISSKVNQWSVLAGSLPVAYIMGGGHGAAIPLGPREIGEFNLTIAQGVLGIALLLSMRLGKSGSLILLGTFLVSFLYTDLGSRDVLAIVCLIVAIPYLVINRRYILEVVKTPFVRKPKPKKIA
jgi:cation:H+ antiporter